MTISHNHGRQAFTISLVVLVAALIQLPQASAQGAVADLQWSGYVDMQYQSGRDQLELDPGSPIASEPDTFALYQGVLELSKEFEGSKLVIDIPFYQARRDGQLEQSNTLVFGEEIAQAFFAVQLSQGLELRAGQFDAIFGYEGNDTVTSYFPRQGLLFAFTPNTQTGVLLTQQWNDAWFSQVGIGNSRQFGEQDPDAGPEWALRAGYENDLLTSSLGLLVNKDRGSYAIGAETFDYEPEILLDFVQTFKWEALEFALNVVYVIPGQEKVDFNNTPTDKESPFGVMALAAYNITDQWTLGLRYELLAHDGSNSLVADSNVTGFDSQLSQVAVAVDYRWSEALVFKAGYDHQWVDLGDEGGKDDFGYLTLAGVHSF